MLVRNCFGFLVVGLALFTGCVPMFQAGLSNAPSANRQSRPQDSHDVITNGTESCGPVGTTNEDPLRHRVPPCHAEEKHVVSQLPAQP
jgi:hypothetical protein